MGTFQSKPDDHVGDVPELVQDRHGSNTETNAARRSSADTLTLLDGSDDLPLLRPPPPPEVKIAAYTPDRLRSGLKALHYASQRHDITPRTATYLSRHKDAYKFALRKTVFSEEACAMVQSLDEFLHREAFLFVRQDPDTENYMRTILKLRKLELIANYGDYVGQEIQQIHALFKEGNPQEVVYSNFAIPPTWANIRDDLLDTDVEETKNNLQVACELLGLEYDHITWLIREWRESDRTFHNRIRENIVFCGWAQLKEIIGRDLREITQIEIDKDICAHYQKAMVDIRDTFFENTDTQVYHLWRLNPQARAKTAEYRDAKIWNRNT